jgi:hypothetical protein
MHEVISETAAVVAIGLLNAADDEGRFLASPRPLECALFPMRPPARPIADCLDELESVGFIRRYQAEMDGRQVVIGLVTSFSRHQVIQRPQSSRLAPPPSDIDADTQAKSSSEACIDQSLIDHVQINDQSMNDQEPLKDDSLHGREGKGREGGGNARARAREDSPPPPPAVSAEIQLRDRIRQAIDAGDRLEVIRLLGGQVTDDTAHEWLQAVGSIQPRPLAGMIWAATRVRGGACRWASELRAAVREWGRSDPQAKAAAARAFRRDCLGEDVPPVPPVPEPEPSEPQLDDPGTRLASPPTEVLGQLVGQGWRQMAEAFGCQADDQAAETMAGLESSEVLGLLAWTSAQRVEASTAHGLAAARRRWDALPPHIRDRRIAMVSVVVGEEQRARA